MVLEQNVLLLFCLRLFFVCFLVKIMDFNLNACYYNSIGLLERNTKGAMIHMKKSRLELEKKLTGFFSSRIGDKKQIQAWVAEAEAKYGLPAKVTTDYITLRNNLSEANNFLLFVFTDISGLELGKYFTDTEISAMKSFRWYEKEIEFPLVFDMTKISDEQYIGKISVRQLMLFKDAQLINYNEKAQRTMKHVIKGETEYYQIALNKEAVKAIAESYYNDVYIPNTITLNLPEDAVFIYDDKKKQLIIKETEYLDILDGYHRYIAMSKVCEKIPDFDYDMELRIVQFSEGKAKRFIWQEDQKTKMRKIDSDALDTAKASNKVVERLNNNPSFLLSNKISRNNGIINAAELSNIIDMLFFKGTRKANELKNILHVTQQFVNGIDRLVSMDPGIIDDKWDKRFTYLIAFLIRYDDVKHYKKYYSILAKDDSIYSGNKLTQSDITRTFKLFGWKGVESEVGIL